MLPARHVIHTVGPFWSGGAQNEPGLLASCYRESLGLAREHELQSMAFPAISTGVFGYPRDKAAQIAVAQVAAFLGRNPLPAQVIFCVFDDENLSIYSDLLS